MSERVGQQDIVIPTEQDRRDMGAYFSVRLVSLFTDDIEVIMRSRRMYELNARPSALHVYPEVIEQETPVGKVRAIVLVWEATFTKGRPTSLHRELR